MLGKRDHQQGLFDVGNVFPVRLKPGTFHYQLAQVAADLFRDEEFAEFYDRTNGRPSVPPSQLALTTVMQHQAQASDEEAIACTEFDLRWAAVLRREAGTPLCAKSTLQLFRAQLVLHEGARTIFKRSIERAREAGLLKGKGLRVALDTKPIDGRGAVQDTFNLLAEGIRQLARALCARAGAGYEVWMGSQGLERYAQSSIKGSAEIDWSDEEARNRLLTEIVGDARKILALAVGQGPQVRQAADLLSTLLLQDVEEQASDGEPAEARVRDGTASGRVPSVSDPEQRHGRKSKSKRFTGHKAAVAVDEESQIITAVAVLAGDAPDARGAIELVQESEQNTGMVVEQTTGDCAYGGGETRQQFTDAGRVLYAKSPQDAEARGLFPKRAFAIDLQAHTVTCPQGHVCRDFTAERNGGKTYTFGAVCSSCPMRKWCTRSSSGRTVRVHPREALLQQARAYQATEEGRAQLRKRVVVEHRLARLGQLGIGQARYVGRLKTGFQLLMAATVANLRRTWNWAAAQEGTQSTWLAPSCTVHACTGPPQRHMQPLTFLMALARTARSLVPGARREFTAILAATVLFRKPAFRPQF